MQILFVATNLPVPLNSGQSIRSMSIIRALAWSGHQISFISFANKDRPQNLDPLSSYCTSIELLDREVKNLTLQPNYGQRLKSLLTLRCYSIERFRSPEMQERIQMQMHRLKYDLIVCDAIYGLINIPQTTVPILLNTHNVEYIILSRYGRAEKNPIKKWYAMAESNLMRVAERNLFRQIAGAMVCSNLDRKILQELLPELPVSVIPNVVDTDSIKPQIAPLGSTRVSPILLFLGVMDWYPNRDAVEYFVHHIFPKVRAECPETRFVVAGRNPPSDFVALFSLESKIEFTGTVPDMRPYLSSASVVVVPLRLGGGTRIKILEACAAGRPVVSTSIGAEGLDLEPGKEILVEDNPEEFARSVVTLLRDPARCDALANAGRTAIVERYSHLTLKKSLDAVILKYFTGTTTGVGVQD
jgi:glycosyltransferase involved in cell wall biosynthesis